MEYNVWKWTIKDEKMEKSQMKAYLEKKKNGMLDTNSVIMAEVYKKT